VGSLLKKSPGAVGLSADRISCSWAAVLPYRVATIIFVGSLACHVSTGKEGIAPNDDVSFGKED